MALHEQWELAGALLAQEWDAVTRESNSNKISTLLRLLDQWLLTGEKVVVVVNNARFLEILEVV